MSNDMKQDRYEAAAQGRTVSRYLNALHRTMPKRDGRQVSVERLEAQLAALPAEIAATTKPIKRLFLYQKQIDLKKEIKRRGKAPEDISAAEDAFVEVAAQYTANRGVSYQAWRRCGVPSDVLQRAGINPRS